MKKFLVLASIGVFVLVSAVSFAQEAKESLTQVEPCTAAELKTMHAKGSLTQVEGSTAAIMRPKESFGHEVERWMAAELMTLLGKGKSAKAMTQGSQPIKSLTR
jgi:hypothetical protein